MTDETERNVAIAAAEAYDRALREREALRETLNRADAQIAAKTHLLEELKAASATMLQEIKTAFDEERERLRLALVEEQPYEEIAETLDISVNAMKVRVFRGVRILRKELEKTGVHA